MDATTTRRRQAPISMRNFSSRREAQLAAATSAGGACLGRPDLARDGDTAQPGADSWLTPVGTGCVDLWLMNLWIACVHWAGCRLAMLSVNPLE